MNEARSVLRRRLQAAGAPSCSSPGAQPWHPIDRLIDQSFGRPVSGARARRPKTRGGPSSWACMPASSSSRLSVDGVWKDALRGPGRGRQRESYKKTDARRSRHRSDSRWGGGFVIEIVIAIRALHSSLPQVLGARGRDACMCGCACVVKARWRVCSFFSWGEIEIAPASTDDDGDDLLPTHRDPKLISVDPTVPFHPQVGAAAGARSKAGAGGRQPASRQPWSPPRVATSPLTRTTPCYDGAASSRGAG